MATATKKPIVEYEVYLESGERAVFRAEKGSIFVFSGEWIAIPNVPFNGNKPTYFPKERVKMIVVNGG